MARGGGRPDLRPFMGLRVSAEYEDHFSDRPDQYARFRPSYPAELFAALASQAPARRLAWDCGAGNGQAALGLAGHFERVVATDASAEQLAHAFADPRVEYRVERAEAVSLEARTVDLVTVGVAIHWFDFERFYAEVRRVARAGGVLAAWAYCLPAIEPRLDGVLARYCNEVLDGYWPERFRYVAERYRTLPFPFEELDLGAFEMRAEWTLQQLLGFLDSWSATQRYESERGAHPVGVIHAELTDAWGDPGATRSIRWPVDLRVGRVR